MEISVHHPDHMLTMLSGFESLADTHSLKDPDARYLNSVLKLNGCDFVSINGSEGFLSAIRSAGAKVYEMIKNFIRGIKNFFFGSNGSKQESAIKETEKGIASKASVVTITMKKRPGYTDYRLENLSREIEAAKKDADRLSNIMRPDKGVYIRLSALVGFNEKIKIADVLNLELSDVIKRNTITSASYDLLKLDDMIAEIMNAMRSHNGEKTIAEEPGAVILKSVDLATELTPKIGNLARQARKSLDSLTKDLNQVNEEYRKYSNSDDSDTKEKYRKMVTTLSRIGTQLSNLITECARTLRDMNKHLGSLAASLELSTQSDGMDVIQLAFAGANKFDE